MAWRAAAQIDRPTALQDAKLLIQPACGSGRLVAIERFELECNKVLRAAIADTRAVRGWLAMQVTLRTWNDTVLRAFTFFTARQVEDSGNLESRVLFTCHSRPQHQSCKLSSINQLSISCQALAA